MTAALVCLLSALFVLGCARRASPAAEIGAASTSSMGDVSPLEQVDASAPDTAPPLAGSCEALGLETIEPCPGGQGLDALADAIDSPELLHFCCANGAPRDSSVEACLNTLQAALACGDKAGIDAANAKIKALVPTQGEPCKRRELRELWKTTPRYKRLCTLRGFP